MERTLILTIEQIVEYYGARWKIAVGFKELKQELSSKQCQARTEPAVMNHLHFCVLSVTLVWLYAGKLLLAAKRQQAVSGRKHFVFFRCSFSYRPSGGTKRF